MHELGTSWRVRSPEDTLTQVRPYLRDLGIDGLIEHKGIGEVRIFETLRRGSVSGYLNLGKGFGSMAAQVSAIMEGIEMSLVETPILSGQKVPIGETCRIVRFRHEETNDIAKDKIHTAKVLKALNLTTTEEAYVYDVDLFFQQAAAHGLSSKGLTNGLASGNTKEEAILHAVYELIERDAINQAQQKFAKFSPSLCPLSLDDKLISEIHHVLASEGHLLQLKVLPSITSAFAIEAVLYPSISKDGFGRYLGWGCSVDVVIACRRAIAEAIQIWSIQEALRQGLIPVERRMGGYAIGGAVYNALTHAPQRSEPVGYWYQHGLSRSPERIWDHVTANSSEAESPGILYRRLINELHSINSALVFCAVLSPDDFPFHVVRCHSLGLKCPKWL